MGWISPEQGGVGSADRPRRRHARPSGRAGRAAALWPGIWSGTSGHRWKAPALAAGGNPGERCRPGRQECRARPFPRGTPPGRTGRRNWRSAGKDPAHLSDEPYRQCPAPHAGASGPAARRHDHPAPRYPRASGKAGGRGILLGWGRGALAAAWIMGPGKRDLGGQLPPVQTAARRRHSWPERRAAKPGAFPE